MMPSILSEKRKTRFLQQLTLSETRLVNLFFLGFILYCLGFSLASSGVMNYILCSSIQIVGVLLFLPSAILLADLRIENIYLRSIYYLYILFLVYVISRGMTFQYYTLRDLLIDGWFGLFIYLSPIVCLFPMKLGLFKKMIDSVKIFSILLVIFFVIFSPFLIVRGGNEAIVMTEVFSRTLGLVSGFVLITFPYHSWKSNILSLTVILGILLMATYQGRRGLMLYCALILLIAGFVYLARGENRMLMIVIFLMLLSTALLVGAEVLNKSSLFSTVMDRGMEDTRSKVSDCFYEDMSTRDWLIGKGLLGQYFCPGVDWDENALYRKVIETGFLQIILKGGVVSLGLLLLIMIPASILGIFFSKNLITKAFGLWIFIGLVNMYPSSVDTFTLNYLMMWIGVGICYSKEIRNLNDATIMQYLKKL
ncbi:hypothetical protein [Belliella aquatica]|nr:hypothetical protein [Belliella aquatica]MCH7404602.1 hypothetical protein [Belliella aquatica]